MSMKGKWDGYYATATPARKSYGCDTTYKLAYTWLKPCSLVEDWGCGWAFFKTLFQGPNRFRYIGLDGSGTSADKIVDLEQYTSVVPGIMLRHVLEHNPNWEQVLKNAIQSCTERMALIIFTPFTADKTVLLRTEKEGLPVYSLNYQAFRKIVGSYCVMKETLQTETQYGEETIFYLDMKARRTANEFNAR